MSKISFLFGMIVGATEFGPRWFWRLCNRPNRLLERVAKAMRVRGDGWDFDDGYDLAANAAARRSMKGK